MKNQLPQEQVKFWLAEDLNNLELLRAKTLLARGWPVAQVAVETGFFDQSHFTKRFKAVPKFTCTRHCVNHPKNFG